MKLRILYAIMLIEICNIQGEYMKFTKMSLVAALLIGSSAFAIENVKVSGDAKLYYSTNDNDNNLATADSLFKKDTSAGQAAISLAVTADLAKGISSGVKLTALSTLGLQGQLVNNVWEGTNGTTDSYMMNEAWVAASLGKSIVKIGRMELDTPLVFTERWSIVSNSFEAAVLINQDLPDTTLVAAYVGGSNGAHNGSANATPAANAGVGIANVVDDTASGSTFTQFWNGAYAAAAINNSFKPLTVQAWYFDASHITNSYWLQADLAMDGITAGVQYCETDLSKANPALKAANVVAAKVGYTMKDMFTASAAYSSVSDDNIAANTTWVGGAGFNLSGGTTPQSKLYTEAYWNYGFVSQADTDTLNITVTSPVNGLFDLAVMYVDADQSAVAGNKDMTELSVTATKTVGPLDVTLAYINADVKTAAVGDEETTNTVQAYLTLNF